MFFSRQLFAFCCLCPLVFVPRLHADDTPSRILELCSKNLVSTDNIKYDLMAEVVYVPNSSKKIIRSAVCRKGDQFDIVEKIDYYEKDHIAHTEKNRTVITPDLSILQLGKNAEREKDNSVLAVNQDEYVEAIVAQKKRANMIVPVLFGGSSSFVLDGHVGLTRFTDLMLNADDVKRLADKRIDSCDCVQLTANTKYGDITVCIDTNNGYIFRELVVTIRQNHVDFSTDAKYMANFPTSSSFVYAIDTLVPQKIGDFVINQKGRFKTTRFDNDGRSYTMNSWFERSNVELSPSSFKAGTFVSDYPVGERVSNIDDKDSGVVYIWDGKKPVAGYTAIEGEVMLGTGNRRFVWFLCIELGAVLMGVFVYIIFF